MHTHGNVTYIFTCKGSLGIQAIQISFYFIIILHSLLNRKRKKKKEQFNTFFIPFIGKEGFAIKICFLKRKLETLEISHTFLSNL